MPPDPPAPGDLVGPYRVVRRLGAGGMGTVHEAVDTVLGRRVALKVITPALAADPAFRERFVGEARAQAALDSPHVVQVFAQGEADGRLYIASQLAPDGDLGALLRREGPLPPERAMDLVAQVAEGLAEAHRAGLVHRDIKPANVLLRRRGHDVVAYLADFGIASRLGAAPSIPGATATGTPGFLAPEVQRGAPATIASDVYALGCLLRATSARSRSRLGRGLARVVRTATAGDPADRHPSATALRDDLRSLARTTPSRSPRPATLRRAGAAAAVAVAGAAVAAGAVLALIPGPDGAPPQAEPGQREIAVAALTDALVREAGLDPASAACTARRLVTERVTERIVERIAEDGRAVRGALSAAVSEAALTAALDCLWREAPAGDAPVSRRPAG